MKKRSRTKNILINTLAGFSTRIATMIAKFLLQSVLIYVLGIQYTGISGLFTSILTILSLAELGIGSAISYELYRPLEERNEQRIAALMNFYKTAYRFVAAIVFIIGIVLIPFLHLFVKDVSDIRENIVIIYVMFILKTTFSYLLVYKSTLLVADQKNYVVSGIQAAVALIRTIIECLLLFITKQYMTYLIAEIIATLCQNLWISHIVDRKHLVLKKYKDMKLNKQEQQKLLKDIKGLAMYKASFTLGSGVDNIVISACVNTSAVGLVSNYILIKTGLEQILKQFYNALIPSVGNLSVTETENKQHEVFFNLFFLNFWISCFCSVSYFIMIQPFIQLWLGTEYLLSVGIAAAIALDFYLACMIETIASFRTANGIFIQGQYRALVMVIINIVLSIILGIYYGIFGIFLATIIARLATQWYDPYLLYKIVFKRTPKKFFLKNYSFMGLTVICALFIWFLTSFCKAENLFIDFMIRGSCCVIIPNCMIVLLFHNEAEFKYCYSQFHKVLNKIKNGIK